jgi:F-box/leucine-rich repeat protein 2/20
MAQAQEPALGNVYTDATSIPEGDQSVQVELAAGKGKNRQRLLRGIQRMSSSPSLTNLRRSRSVSAPYRSSTRSTLSCVSLAATGPPQTPPSARSSTPQPSPLVLHSSSSSRPDTPAAEFPFYDEAEAQLVARRVEDGKTFPSRGTAHLPADIKLSRPESLNKVRSVSAPQKPPFHLWDHMPHEISVHVFSFLKPKELVQASRVSKSFYNFCFDGQLWTSLDASEFYQEIPAESLARIIVAAGPFIKDLNLRGCVQVEHYKRAESIVRACRNLMSATLEGCRNFQKTTLHTLLQSNEKLVHLNLTGLPAVSNKSCRIIADSCPQLETFNISWCGKVDSRGVKAVVEGCTKLKDLRAGEVRGFDSISLAKLLFDTNNLERLMLSGCAELTDEALQVMMHGVDPEIDILTEQPVVPPRKLRHLDLSRCTRLSDAGVKAIGYSTPELEGLQLSRCRALTDAALEPIIASTPSLTHLELEDLEQLTNGLLSEHIARGPSAATLEHLSLSYFRRRLYTLCCRATKS